MDEYAKVGSGQITLLTAGLIIWIVVPILIAIIWKVKKKESFKTIIIGAVTFIVFVVVEKLIQNALLFPATMGLKDHPASTFFGAHAVLLAFMLGLFPGLFEETGRLVAFKTILKNKKNRETSISYGIGHGGVEVLFVLGVNFIVYLVYAMMINNGTYGLMVDQLAAVDPGKVNEGKIMAEQLATLSFGFLAQNVVERVFAVLFHVGASILVFYACRDKDRFWLYPLAILLHTAMDFAAGLVLLNIVNLSMWALEGICAVIGGGIFACGYFLLYKRDEA
ncbi:MAG: YhfC family intramembrane metalloprotease [Lachnospiraceae bacterium]|nr:YhfC family intramembrane metalloprotease [Lachnospiraceae bacterium]